MIELTSRTIFAIAVTAMIFLGGHTAHARDGGGDPVLDFVRICYAKVPDVDAIRKMARDRAWREIKGDDLKKYTEIENPTVLEGWDAKIGERFYRVAIVQSPLSDKMKNAFPSLGEGTATSCSMVLDEKNVAAVFNADMQTLAEKPPVSKNVPEGGLRTTTWAGGNNDLKVFLFSKANANGLGGLLAVTILKKAK